jgi:carboxyl-terminal processing protease
VGRIVRRFLISGFLLLLALPFTAAFAEGEGWIIEELKLFSKGVGVISEAYVGDVTPRHLLYQAMKGMLGSLDRFSEFIEPERFKLLQIQIKGEYAGIGALLEMVHEQVVIKAVQPGMPAEKAGLLPGDILLKIDGVSIAKKAIGDVSALLRGDENTPVLVTLQRPPSMQVLDIKILRQKIVIQSVQDARMIGKALAYFRLSGWQDNTSSQVDQTLKDLKKKGMKALIIDLRNNDGGLLAQAVALAKRFLPKGKKIVSVKSKIPEQRKEYFVSENGNYVNIELVILVNGYSASASEVFSGAMQDHKRATLIGVKTFGKGSVQSVVPFDDVSAMKLTTARYATPSGRVIDMIGLTPDREVANSPDGTPGVDRQILEAITVFKKYM